MATDTAGAIETSTFQKSQHRPRSMGRQAYYTTSMVRRTAKVSKHLLGLNVTVHNREAIPMEGPVVLVLNHESYLDPLVLGAVTPRNGAIMAKHDLWRNPFVAPLLISRGDIAVKRHKAEARDEAKQKGKNVLAHGGLLALFGAGHINRIGNDDDWKFGFAEMAVEFDATIVVGKLVGTGHMLPMAIDRKEYGMKVFDRRAPLEAIFSFPITEQVYRGMSVEAIKNMCRTIHHDLVVPRIPALV